MKDESFDRLAGLCSILIALGGVVYAIAFVIVLQKAPRAANFVRDLILMLGGILLVAVFVSLYRRLRATSEPLALLGLLLGVLGAGGSAAHGAYGLAVIVNPPEVALPDPNPVDPRGFFTFAVTAVAIAVISWAMLSSTEFPRRLGQLGFLSATLLVVVYLGRLIVYDPEEPVLLVAALLTGLIVNPAWFLWLGLQLRHAPQRRGQA